MLEVRINGQPSGKIGQFVLRDAMLLAQPDELEALGLRLPPQTDPDSRTPIALVALPGITWRLDQPTQTLFITIANDRLVPLQLDLDTRPRQPSPEIESGSGVTLNYDIVGIASQASTAVTGLVDLRAFSPYGIVSSSFLGSSADDARFRPSGRVIRLDTTYSFADGDTGRRYSVGDFITGGLGWTRPIRMGGLQLVADFSTRPDLITFPLPGISSSVTTPSTIDVLINGSPLVSQQVEPGPFEIPQMPVVTGAGTISMSVTNALGQQVTTNTTFYASSELLAPAYQTFAVELGAVRRNWGVVSNDYGTLAARASYRRGLSDRLTFEAAGEATKGTIMAGSGMVLNVANLAILNTAVSASMGAGRQGMQVRFGVQRLSQVLSFAASATVASRGFRDIASANGEPVAKRQINGSIGLSLGRVGSVGLAYAQIDRRASSSGDDFPRFPRPIAVPRQAPDLLHILPSQRTQILTASYSVQFGALTLYATGFRSVSTEANTGVMAGLSIPLGRTASANASAGTGPGGEYAQLQASRSATDVGDFGYQLFASSGAGTRAFAQVDYKAPWALLSGGIDHAGNQTTARLEARGALSFIDDAVFASNTIYDSFAIVDTDGLAGVSVLHENRLVGKTDARGRYLVTDLQAFTINHLGIAPLDVPIDVTLDQDVRDVRPQDRSGVIVKFPTNVSRAALLRLVGENGDAVPAGSTVTLRGSGVVGPVGYDGEAYILDLKPTNIVDIVRPDGGRCSARFEYVRAPGVIPVIGPLACKAPGG
ncbi:fimbria/pilus outer membrane usher protein [Blastomonas fulva]|uniref:fimbria/pilus outer membrane usher protein n=1 Tax=Blastomonas fulva TaxID=1550728 RepID=UPI003D29F73D